MGAKKIRKQRFIAAHPWCCFCGGGTATETEDHVPPRVLFHSRVWPEGYTFPACQRCNSATRLIEQVIALLARVDQEPPEAARPEIANELREIMRGIRNNQPALFAELQPTVEQLEKFYRERGIAMPVDSPPAQTPLLNAKGPIVTSSVREFSRKLFLALHYKETRRIILVKARSDTGGGQRSR
jgi:hypothetical protein